MDVARDLLDVFLHHFLHKSQGSDHHWNCHGGLHSPHRFDLNFKLFYLGRFSIIFTALFIIIVIIIIIIIIIKITISSIVIGLKNSYFPLIHLPSCYRTVYYRTACYRTVQQTNHIQSCSLNQPITFKVAV